MYQVNLTKLQIDFLLKFCEGVKKTPGIRFSSKPDKKALYQQIMELEDSLLSSLNSGEISD